MPIPSPNLKEVDLTPTDFSMLITKAQHAGRVFSRLQLLKTSQVWLMKVLSAVLMLISET